MGWTTRVQLLEEAGILLFATMSKSDLVPTQVAI
jgi:hypothetical protein